jgi:hypothetical protein
MAVEISQSAYSIKAVFDQYTYEGSSVKDQYERALLCGFLRSLWAGFTRRPHQLQILNDEKRPLHGSHFAGVREVPIERICGSEGLSHDFDDRFYPLSGRTRPRWLSIAKAISTSIDLLPVELIQVGKDYFVRDGHHRISVARAFGHKTIVAQVTVWDVDHS